MSDEPSGALPSPASPSRAAASYLRKATERVEELGLPPHRVIDDPKALRALAHPTRVALVEALGLRGTLTATQAAEQIDESPTNCAFHLRTLAKYGYVVEAEGGRGRERPWQLAQSGLSWFRDDENPAAGPAMRAAMALLQDRWFERARRYTANESAYAPEIRDASTQTETVWFATPEEMAAIKADLDELIFRHLERFDPERRPAGAIPFEGLFFIHPFGDPPDGGSAAAPDAPEPHTSDRTDG